MVLSKENVHPRFALNGITFDRTAENFFRAVAAAFPHDERNENYARDIEKFLREYLNEEDAIVCKTSGSTGEPKSVPIEKSRMRASARMTCRFFGLEAGTRALLCLPIPYIAGRMMLVRALTAGWDVRATAPSSRPLEGFPNDTRFDFAAMVPLQLYESAGELHRIRKILVGGASVSDDFLNGLSAKTLPDTEIYQSYAMTETITHVAVRQLYPCRERVYTALEGVRFSLSSEKTLIVDAPQVTPERIVTRDRVELLDGRRFLWRGRADTVINSGGIKLFPEEAEAALSGILPPGHYFVAGVPDPRLGQRMVLFVEGREKDFPGLESELLARFDPYHRPKETVFVKCFPQTDTGKTDRRAVIAFYRKEEETKSRIP